MTKEQEAQQAQTIARIKQEYERHSGRTYHAFTDFAPLVTEFYANLSVLLEIVDSQVQTIAEQAKELKLLRYVLDAEKTARIYEDGTGAAGEALFHARKELEEYDAKMNPEQTTDSKEVAR